MNSQVENPHNGTSYQNDPHSVVESEEPHEKLSVMKKVKAKAKKIKKSFTKRAHGGGHGHEEPHDHGVDHDDYDEDDDEDDDDDEDEEMREDPEIHGSPMYESGAVKSAIHGHDVNQNDPKSPATTPTTPVIGTNPSRVNEYPENLDHGPEGDNGIIIGESGKSTVLQGDPQAHKGGHEAHKYANYQTEVSDPDPTDGAGAKEAGISPLIQTFEKMSVHHEPTSKQDPHTKTPTHDQFSPEQSPHTQTPTHDQFSSEQTPGDQFSSERSHPTNTSPHDEFSIEVTPPEKRPSHDQFSSELSSNTKTDADEPGNQSGNTYTDKLSYATTALAGTAISTKNVVASKLGYGPKDDNPVAQSPRESETTKTPQSPSSGGGYLSKITSTVSDKLGYGPKDDTPLTQSPRGSEPTKTPQCEVAGGGGYMSTIAGKLGYGPKDDTSVPQSPGYESKDKETSAGYGSKIASSVTETLGPMYGKVAGAGSTVLSKVTGSGTGTDTTGTLSRETEDLGGKGPGAKQSWMEKLKPGEEDKALSNTISEALYKRKDETNEPKEESKPMGKVTESEHVARRLGTGDEERENVDDSGEVKVDAADPTGANKGMVNMVKGAVSSWFGKGEPGQATTEEKKVQEPSNES